MRRFRIPRRTLLRGAGGIAIGLPLLEIMADPQRARAAGATAPKRFVTFFSSAGTIHENWVPSGSETDFKLSRILTPLEPHRSKVVVVDGLTNFLGTPPPGDDHMRGIGTMLTATELLKGETRSGAPGFEPCGLAGGISLDQFIAESIGKTTKLKSLELGVQTGNVGDVTSYTSYAAANRPLPSENDPKAVYSRVFTDLPAAGGPQMADQAATRRLAQRKSVLDSVIESYGALAPKLGATDKATLEAHQTAIRELEMRLTATPETSSTAACAKPMAPTIDAQKNDNFPMVGQLQMDLLVMALACDLTRVATLQWEAAYSDVRFTWLGADRGHHTISHDGDNNSASVEMLTKINVWYAEQFAYFLQKLDAIKEGDGTLLDSCVVFWGNELARGNVHSHWPMPFVLAGSGGGALKTGRFLTYPKGDPTTSHTNLLVSMMNAVGVPGQTFGNPKYCTGPLNGL
ncbi:MAG TPA: DUF1552 domain-containing protein [Polyangiaceae bacterium]|nr:DUF1552 domain-containing protein [Polyangiaceae bacterium]